MSKSELENGSGNGNGDGISLLFNRGDWGCTISILELLYEMEWDKFVIWHN